MAQGSREVACDWERRHSCRCLKYNAKRMLIEHGQQRDWALRAMFWTAAGMSPLPGSLRSQSEISFADDRVPLVLLSGQFY